MMICRFTHGQRTSGTHLWITRYTNHASQEESSFPTTTLIHINNSIKKARTPQIDPQHEKINPRHDKDDYSYREA